MIYLATFTASTSLVYLASKCKGSLEVLLTIFGLILPCLLAGGRDETIGTDVLTYAKWMCENAQVMSFSDFLVYESKVAAVGWNIFTWISVRLLGGLPGYLFAIEALCVVPVYLAIRKLSKEQVWLGMLIWLLLCYAFTLNGMRQSVAMGFVFYSIIFVIERRPYAFVFSVAFAMLFHQTALIGFLLYPLASLVVYGKSLRMLFGKWKGFMLVVLTVVCFAAAFAFGAQIVHWASFLKESYSFQVDHIGENDFSIAGFYLFVAMVFCWFVSRKDFESTTASLVLIGKQGAGRTLNLSKIYRLLCAITIIGCLAWQLNFVASSLGRIGYYGSMFIPLLGVVLASNEETSRSNAAYLVITALVYFVVMTLILGKEGVHPYSSMLFGIL